MNWIWIWIWSPIVETCLEDRPSMTPQKMAIRLCSIPFNPSNAFCERQLTHTVNHGTYRQLFRLFNSSHSKNVQLPHRDRTRILYSFRNPTTPFTSRSTCTTMWSPRRLIMATRQRIVTTWTLCPPRGALTEARPPRPMLCTPTPGKGSPCTLGTSRGWVE